MKGDKIAKFMALAGQESVTWGRDRKIAFGSKAQRALGAQLLLSEVLEYVIHGLGVEPEVNGVRITKPDDVHYHAAAEPDAEEMVDGIADVAYTMYWNALAFGLPIEEAFDLVCDNNLEKFVALGSASSSWAKGKTQLESNEWDCRLGITWPPEVATVLVVEYSGQLYAVGKDARGKVRKPSSYASVDLSMFLSPT